MQTREHKQPQFKLEMPDVTVLLLNVSKQSKLLNQPDKVTLLVSGVIIILLNPFKSPYRTLLLVLTNFMFPTYQYYLTALPLASEDSLSM